MSLAAAVKVIDIDSLVNDPRFLPHYGWVDTPHVFGAGAAIQQWRSEFLEFAAVLDSLNVNGKCLQLGLGMPGASHLVWSSLFNEAWTLDVDPNAVNSYLERIPGSQRLVVGSTFDPNTKKQFLDKGPFDLLFIDADHSYMAARSDFFAWGELVRHGGIIALHDTVQGRNEPYPNPTMCVWLLIERLNEEGCKFTTIGTELGISYTVKGQK
jgi:hypothetical protein